MVKAFAETAPLKDQATLDFMEIDVNDFDQKQPASADLVSCFLPFVLAKEHTAWGLPKRGFHPQTFLKSVWDLLKPDGILILSNLSEAEVHVQAELLDALEASLPSGQSLKRHVQALCVETRFMKCAEERRFLWMLQKIDEPC